MDDALFPFEITASRREFVLAGWFSYLPGPAFELYTAIMLLGACGERADEQSIRRFLASPQLPCLPRRLGDFDEPLEPDLGQDGDEISWNRARWHALRAEAEHRRLPLATTNDLLALMCALGLLERDQEGGWRIVLPVPLLEDVIGITDERRRALANLRLHVQFAEQKRLLREWLDERLLRTGEPLVTSIAELCEWLPLSGEEIRWALALLDEGSVLSIDPRPETLAEGARLTVSVDWEQLEDDLRFKDEIGRWVASTASDPAELGRGLAQTAPAPYPFRDFDCGARRRRAR